VPGLSFICDFDRDIDALAASIRRALDAACHDATYTAATLQRARSWLLAASAYPEYPIAAFDFGDVAIHLEGRLYGPAPTEALLGGLAQTVFDRDDTAQEWVRAVDGEFVVFALQRSTARIVILNDLLGRLPLYRRRTSRTLVLSRELRFIARLLPRLGSDPMGVAQYLLLGFPLGGRTLLNGIERVAPATCVRIDVRTQTVRETSATALDIGCTRAEARSTRTEARDLATLFASGCRTRAAASRDDVVSLSGGADARSVAACLHRLAIPFRSVTFLDADGEAAADVAVAERLAALFDSQWHLVRLRAPSRTDRLSLLRRKQGLNPLSMSYLVPYLEGVAQRFGRGIVLFTGDGGDKLMPNLRPTVVMTDADGAAAEVLRVHRIVPLEQASALTRVGAADIVNELRDRLAAYPEELWPDRYVHFEIFERAFKWLFEGEDRNRSFFWSTTPFYATPFFLAAMRCSERHKAHRTLYRDFLLEISPAAAGVEYAGLGTAIDSTAFRVAAKAASVLAEAMRVRPSAMPSAAPRHGAGDAAAADGLRQQITRCDAIADHLDPDHLAAFLDAPAAAVPGAIDALFTFTSLIEDLAGDSGATRNEDHGVDIPANTFGDAPGHGAIRDCEQ